jgi:hypothetical protein
MHPERVSESTQFNPAFQNIIKKRKPCTNSGKVVDGPLREHGSQELRIEEQNGIFSTCGWHRGLKRLPKGAYGCF